MATRGDLEKGGVKKVPGKVPAPLYPQHEGEREWVAWLIPVFFVTNITVFVVTMYVNNCPVHTPARDGKCVGHWLGRFGFQPLHQNPLLGPSSATLTKMGALVWEKVVHHHEGWRLISSMWLHAGALHLLVNMFSLMFVGMRLETQFGYGQPSNPLFHSSYCSNCSYNCCFLDSFSANWCGVPPLRARRQCPHFSVHQKHHLRWCLWCSLRSPRCHALRTPHQLDHLLQQGHGRDDPPDRHRGEPGDRHPPTRQQLRSHLRFPDGLPARLRGAHAPPLGMVAAIRHDARQRLHHQEVPPLPVDLAGRSIDPCHHRIRDRHGVALPRHQRQRQLPVVPLPQLRPHIELDLHQLRQHNRRHIFPSIFRITASRIHVLLPGVVDSFHSTTVETCPILSLVHLIHSLYSIAIIEVWESMICQYIFQIWTSYLEPTSNNFEVPFSHNQLP